MKMGTRQLIFKVKMKYFFYFKHLLKKATIRLYKNLCYLFALKLVMKQETNSVTKKFLSKQYAEQFLIIQ